MALIDRIVGADEDGVGKIPHGPFTAMCRIWMEGHIDDATFYSEWSLDISEQAEVNGLRTLYDTCTNKIGWGLLLESTLRLAEYGNRSGGTYGMTLRTQGEIAALAATWYRPAP